MSRPLFVDSRRDLLGSLIDYAGMFPPASLSLEDAVSEYRALRASSNAWMLGSFVVAASRMVDLAGLLISSMVADEPPWRVGAVLDGDPGRAAAATASFDATMAPAATVAATEVRLPAEVTDGRPPLEAADAGRLVAAAAASVSATATPYLELQPTASIRNGVAAVALLRRSLGRPFAAKLRCGGPTAASFPSPDVVARFIAACRDEEIRFKLTAGLHRPVRHFDTDLGVFHHGFLNVLIATAAAEQGVDVDTLTDIIEEAYPAALHAGPAGAAWRNVRVTAATVKRIRAERLSSFGSCSFEEPVRELSDLGILEAAPA